MKDNTNDRHNEVIYIMKPSSKLMSGRRGQDLLVTKKYCLEQ